MKKLPLALLALAVATLARAYEPPAGVEFIPDLAYRSEHAKQKLDILRPANRTAPLPAILLVHGGGWRDGRREEQRGIASRFVQAGYIAIPVGYRLTGEAPFPACIHDVVAAARWVRAHAKDYGIDPERIGALGHSAGAHLVLMLALAEPAGKFAPGFLEGVSGRVNAVVATAAPTDFLRLGEDRGRPGGTMFFNDEPPATRDEKAARCSPATYADASAPPVLLMHGTADRTVPPAQSERLLVALRAAQAPLVERVLLDGRPHDFILSHETLLVPMQVAFFDRTIGKDAGRYAREIAVADDSRPARDNRELAATWLEKFDADHDGYVARAEFPGGQELFERFDRAVDGRRIALPGAVPTAGTDWKTDTAISNDGREIQFLWTAPPGQGRVPVVIFAHGAPGGVGAEALRRYTTSSRWTRFLAEGFAVCITDYRGHPENDPFAVLRGDATAADDLAAVIKFLGRQPRLDGQRLAVIGQSLGGVVTLDAVGREKIAPACIVATAPATYPFIGYRGGRGGKRDRDLTDAEIDRPGTLARIEKINLPVLIVQGTEDHTDLCALNKKLYEVMKAAGKDVRLELFEGAGHPFTLGPEGENYRRALDLTVDFIRRHTSLRAAEQPAK